MVGGSLRSVATGSASDLACDGGLINRRKRSTKRNKAAGYFTSVPCPLQDLEPATLLRSFAFWSSSHRTHTASAILGLLVDNLWINRLNNQVTRSFARARRIFPPLGKSPGTIATYSCGDTRVLAILDSVESYDFTARRKKSRSPASDAALCGVDSALTCERNPP